MLDRAVSDTLKQAVGLVDSGDKRRARELLFNVIDREPDNAAAWGWLAHAAASRDERKIALEQLVRLRPQIENRLRATVERTVQAIHGEDLHIKFVT